MTPEDIIARLGAPLSPRRRFVTVVAMLGGLTIAGLVSLLWMAEPNLPPATQAAFGTIVLIGVAWGVYGVWVLTRRTPLFALERAVAAWLALGAGTAFVAGALTIAIARDQLTPLLLGGLVAVECVAVANVILAVRRRAALLRRKRQLGG